MKSLSTRKQIKLIAAAFGALFLFGASVAKSEDPTCRIKGIESMPRITTSQDGVPLTKTVRYLISGESYDIPIGYTNGSASWVKKRKDFRNALAGRVVNIEKGFGFGFWVPSLRYHESTLAQFTTSLVSTDERDQGLVSLLPWQL